MDANRRPAGSDGRGASAVVSSGQRVAVTRHFLVRPNPGVSMKSDLSPTSYGYLLRIIDHHCRSRIGRIDHAAGAVDHRIDATSSVEEAGQQVVERDARTLRSGERLRGVNI